MDTRPRPTSYRDVEVLCRNCRAVVTVPVAVAHLDTFQCYSCGDFLDLVEIAGRNPELADVRSFLERPVATLTEAGAARLLDAVDAVDDPHALREMLGVAESLNDKLDVLMAPSRVVLEGPTVEWVVIASVIVFEDANGGYVNSIHWEGDVHVSAIGKQVTVYPHKVLHIRPLPLSKWGWLLSEAYK